MFHLLLAVSIVALVLLQRGRGADAGAGFGAGASGTVFGARGSASFLSRTTAVLATLFFLSSLGLVLPVEPRSRADQRHGPCAAQRRRDSTAIAVAHARTRSRRRRHRRARDGAEKRGRRRRVRSDADVVELVDTLL